MNNLVPIEGQVTLLLRNDPLHPNAREKLVQAKREALDGDAAGAAASDPFYRKCADCITEAQSIDHTLRSKQVAEEMARSQSWVSQLLKWRKGGYPEGGPFRAGNAKRKKNSLVTTKDSGALQLAAKISRKLTQLKSDLHALTNYLQKHPQGDLLSAADKSTLKEICQSFKQVRQVRLIEGKVA